MTVKLNLICDTCKHLNEGGFGCKAFKEGIPDKIIIDNKHDKPLPEQKNSIVFEKNPFV